jgi:hypothetical protein
LTTQTLRSSFESVIGLERLEVLPIGTEFSRRSVHAICSMSKLEKMQVRQTIRSNVRSSIKAF